MNLKSSNHKKINIYFSWTDLPTYGYFLLKYIDKKIKKNKFINFRVISTLNINRNLYKENTKFYKKIVWLKKNKKYNWQNLGLEVPHIFFQSGWSIKAFNSLGKLVKSESKSNTVILGVDNSFQKNNFRQFIGSSYFKFFLKFLFDYALVPGKSGRKLMLNFGFKNKEIFTGVYSSLTHIFKNKQKPINRKKQFLYVGQFIHRKNIFRLIKAFEKVTHNKQDWKLILVGDGPLKSKIINLPKNIKILKNQSPKKLSKLYNESLFFILPSLREHWGLVVHEASLCGCFLLLSDNISSSCEFSNKKNTLIFKPKLISSIQKSITMAMQLNYDKLNAANHESQKLGNLINYDNFLKNFIRIINLSIKKKIFT